MTSAVLDEAMKKAAVAWVAVGDGPALGLWCMPLDGSLIFVTGPGEQHAPGLADASRVTVRLRGDHGGLIVMAEMNAVRVLPGSEDWETVALQLAGKRLNASGSAEDLTVRWVETGCVVVRVTPDAAEPVTGAALPSDSEAAEPRDTPARVDVHHPFKLHKVRRR